MNKKILDLKKKYEIFVLEESDIPTVDYESYKESFLDWLYCTPELDDLLEFIFKRLLK